MSTQYEAEYLNEDGDGAYTYLIFQAGRTVPIGLLETGLGDSENYCIVWPVPRNEALFDEVVAFIEEKTPRDPEVSAGETVGFGSGVDVHAILTREDPAKALRDLILKAERAVASLAWARESEDSSDDDEANAITRVVDAVTEMAAFAKTAL